MASDRPNFLKAAFLNVYNLSLLGGALAASALTGDHLVGAAALGAEALWLLFAPDAKLFQRAVIRWVREDQEKEERARLDELMGVLPERDWQRAHALAVLKRDIERDMQHNPSFQALLLQPELDKLELLTHSFATLANACARAETYLSATDADVRDVRRQVDVQRGVEKNMKDVAVQEIARKNVAVLERRLVSIQDIQNFLARARGQMNLIENSVRLLRDQVLTMASPDQLGEQLNDLLTGVDAIQSSAKEQEAVLSRIQLEPLEPLPAEGDRDGSRGGVKIR